MYCKVYLVVFIFFNAYIVSSQEKEIEVIYVQAIGKMKDTIYPEAKKLKDLNYVLIANSYSAIFQRSKMMDNDNTSRNEHFMHGIGANGIFYKNIKTKDKLHKLNFLGEDILIVDSTLEWVITKESKIINGFLTYKAYNVQKIFSEKHNKEFEIITTAWFTPELPFPFGPKGTDGLPGLILEVSYYNESVYLIAEKISFKTITDPKERIKIIKPEARNIMTREEFVKYTKDKVNRNN